MEDKPAELTVITQSSAQEEPRSVPPPYTPRTYQSPTVAIITPSSDPPVTAQPTLQQQNQNTVPPKLLGYKPCALSCPSCRYQVATTVAYQNSNKTHIMAGFICGVTLWCCLCCFAVLPYYLKSCKNAEHFCPNCNYYIGGYAYC